MDQAAPGLRLVHFLTKKIRFSAKLAKWHKLLKLIWFSIKSCNSFIYYLIQKLTFFDHFWAFWGVFFLLDFECLNWLYFFLKLPYFVLDVYWKNIYVQLCEKKHCKFHGIWVSELFGSIRFMDWCVCSLFQT